MALVAIVRFRGNKLAHEHIYWDQASVLKQIGLLEDSDLPVLERRRLTRCRTLKFSRNLAVATVGADGLNEAILRQSGPM